MSTLNETDWNDAIDRCVEGLISHDELSTLLMRIDLPEEGRRAINDTLALVNGLNKAVSVPEIPTGAISRLLDSLRNQPLPAGILSVADLKSPQLSDLSDFPETPDASESREFQELSDALDSFHHSTPNPGAARDRLLARLGKGTDAMDVRPAFDSERFCRGVHRRFAPQHPLPPISPSMAPQCATS